MAAPSLGREVPFDLPTLIEICQRHGVTMVGLVGSMARGEATDRIVRFAQPISLIGLISLEQELSAALGRQVDLLTESALSPYLRDRILRDMQAVYAA